MQRYEKYFKNAKKQEKKCICRPFLIMPADTSTDIWVSIHSCSRKIHGHSTAIAVDDDRTTKLPCGQLVDIQKHPQPSAVPRADRVVRILSTDAVAERLHGVDHQWLAAVVNHQDVTLNDAGVNGDIAQIPLLLRYHQMGRTLLRLYYPALVLAAGQHHCRQ